MFRSQIKLILPLSSSLLILMNSALCMADISTMQNGLQMTNTYQHPGDYYNDPSKPTPNPAIFPPPPPKPTGLPLQPFTPTLTGQLNLTKDEASKLLSGYTNPSLPTPNPAFYPSSPVVTPAASSASTTTEQPSTEAGASTTQGGTASGGAAAAGGPNALQAASSAANGTNTPSSSSSGSSNSMANLQNCVPGNYSFTSAAKPITVGAMYGSNNVSTPTMTYSVSGMQNGKCVVTVTQSAVVPPTVKNGTYYAAPASASPAANVSKCAFSPGDLSAFVTQTQKTQTGGYYGSSTVGQNVYNQQSVQNSCQSSLMVNGAAIPYTNVPP